MNANSFILFAEDNSSEAELLRLACQRAGIDVSRYFIVRDGLQALSYLESAESSRNAVPRPTRVIADLDMPLFDGFRLLCWIRGHPEYKDLPVTIMTQSATSDAKERALSLGCDRFLQKPPTSMTLSR